MTPKEKAEELVYEFRKQFDWLESDYSIDLYRDTRQCALIAVDEILDLIITIYDYDREQLDPYWKQVKQELEKL